MEQNYDPMILMGTNSNANYIYFLASMLFFLQNTYKIWLLWYANVVKPENREITFRATIFVSDMTSNYWYFCRTTSNTGVMDEKNQETILYVRTLKKANNLTTDLIGFYTYLQHIGNFNWYNLKPRYHAVCLIFYSSIFKMFLNCKQSWIKFSKLNWKLMKLTQKWLFIGLISELKRREKLVEILIESV